MKKFILVALAVIVLVPAAGVAGCVVLAFALPLSSVVGGAAAIVAAALLYPFTQRREHR